jgi:hypothetical protein
MLKKDSKDKEGVEAAFDMAMRAVDIEVLCDHLGISCFLIYQEMK